MVESQFVVREKDEEEGEGGEESSCRHWVSLDTIRGGGTTIKYVRL